MPNGRFKYEKLTKYPHLEQEDIITWERFINRYPEAYKTVDYDFALSKVKEATEEADRLDISGAERVYKYRADVIGYGDSEIHVIELKNRATPAVLGHVRAEKIFFDRDEKPDKPTKAIVIAREMTPELDHIARASFVELILV